MNTTTTPRTLPPLLALPLLLSCHKTPEGLDAAEAAVRERGFDWRDGILYFAFVDRFWDGTPENNGTVEPGVPAEQSYWGGDWPGVLQKIEEGYFDALGVNVLWLSVPVDNAERHRAGQGDTGRPGYHGYWPKDLERPEEHFGTLADLKAVVDAAHRHGLRVVLDYAMNHVDRDSPVFREHPEWFWPLEKQGRKCVCGQGCSWDDPEEAQRCWFDESLPDFNFRVPEARAFSVGNARSWIESTGADGLRLDAVKHIDESWILDLRAALSQQRTGRNVLLLGETYSADRDQIRQRIEPGRGLDGQFDFPLRAAIVSSVLLRTKTMRDLDAFLRDNDRFYGDALMSTFLGNHDLPRTIHLAEDVPLWPSAWAEGRDRALRNRPSLPSQRSAFERLALGFTLILTLPGLPMIYYGDEIGLAGAGDPDNRRPFPWTGWTEEQQWLLSRLRQLIFLRRGHSALRRGTRRSLFVDDDTIAYEMVDASECVLVALNRSAVRRSIPLLRGGRLFDLLETKEAGGDWLELAPRGARILLCGGYPTMH